MNIIDIQTCADFFQINYLKTFYLVVNYNNKSFILIGEKGNFPHLMGIQNSKKTMIPIGGHTPTTIASSNHFHQSEELPVV